MIRPRTTGFLATCVSCLALAACGSNTKTAAIPSGGEKATSSAPATTETTAKPTFGKPTAAVKAIAAAAGTNSKKKPKVPKPKGKPPTQLIVDDIVKGSGPAAKAGDPLTVDYVGASWSTGKEFDSSWKRKQPFTVTLGQGQVIQGWDQGLVGMKKGGRRLLVIPPDIGYGASGSPPAIGPNETLVFDIDLRKIG